jgi:putative spermidine/putrescine transport system substrate-binding protein
MSQLLAACAQAPSVDLRISLLRGSIPNQLLNEFRKYAEQASVEGGKIDLTVIPEANLQALFTLLQDWKREGKLTAESSWKDWFSWIPFIGKPDRAVIPDWAMIGDYWLSLAIQQGLVRPITDSRVMGSPIIQNPQLKQLVTRNKQGLPDVNGDLWAMPHRVGSTLIAYRQDLFAQHQLAPPQDWSDLWRPELRGKITLLNQPREVIGLVLKKLGKSYNTADLNAVPNLKEELQALHRQVKLYSSDRYLEPVLLDEAWVTVGWSSDILPLMRNQPKIAAIVPRSGTALWAELWVLPAGKPEFLHNKSLRWIEFYNQTNIATQFAQASWAAPPALFTIPRTQLPQKLQDNQVLIPNQENLQASEFLNPLSESTIKQYEAFWQELRQQKA